MGEILISDLFKMILKRIKMLIFIAFLCGVVALGYCKVLATPEYSARASIFADNGGITSTTESTDEIGESVKSTDVASSLNLLKTYVGLLDEIDFYAKVNAKMFEDGTSIGLDDSQIKNLVTLTAREDTMLIDITVRSSNGEFAVDLANAIADCAPEHIKGYVPQATSKKFRTAYTYSKVFPNTTLTVLTSAFFGAAVFAVIIVIRQFNDNTIKGEDDFFEKYDIPVLGSVPSFDMGKPKKGKGEEA